MFRNPIIILVAFLCATAISCSGSSSPVLPDSGNMLSPGSQQSLTDSPLQAQSAHNSVLGYYDISFDIESRTFEAVEDRTAEFTLNVVPFLNKMAIPKNGITFGSIVVHDDNPEILGIDVDFGIYHPFPGLEQYNAYDLRGVIIGNGADSLLYNNLKVARRGVDLWLKNPDGYTRWFNPTDFTTQLIFGYAPGGYQNLAGDAQVNAFKYYGKHLAANDNYWSWLTNGPTYDGIFESGSSRRMEIEFPMPPDGLGLAFGYAVVVTWEEQGPTGPFSPVHCPEAIAASVSQTPDVWYDQASGLSGGNLVLDIDLYGWDYQPSTIKIESSVLDGIAEFDAATCGQPLMDNVSTYHVEAAAKPLTTPDDHYYWVIAEYDGFDYANNFPDIPHADGPLAAFFRYDCNVVPGFVEEFGIITPDGGETLYMTLDSEIQWNPGGVGISDVSIEWSPDDFTSEIYSLASSTPNDGSFTWVYIPKIDTDTAKIRISDIAGSDEDESQGYFSIKPPVVLDFQDPQHVTNSSVNFTVVSYFQNYDEISPALSQDLDGNMHVCWHSEKAYPDPPNPGYRDARDTVIRSYDGDSWDGNGGFLFTSGGTAAEVHELRRDYMKLAPTSNNTTYAAVWHWSIYFSLDVDHFVNGHNEYNYNYLTNRIYHASEIMGDDSHLFLVSDGTSSVGDGPGIYSMRFPTPNWYWQNPDPMKALTPYGELSHSRSWAFQDGGLVLAYWTLDNKIKLLRQTIPSVDVWDDSEVIFDGSGYTGCKDPSICNDPNGQLFCIWKGQQISSGEYHLLASKLTSSSGTWSTPMVIATSTSDDFDDQHITVHNGLYAMPDGDDETILLVGWETDAIVHSQILLGEAWDWLPSGEVSDGTDISRDPDVLCANSGGTYNYDAIFTWSYEITPGSVGYGDYDIYFRNADFVTP